MNDLSNIAESNRVINNKIQMLYTKEWDSLENEEIDGLLFQVENYEEVTEYGTERLIIKFINGDKSNTYALERYAPQ